MSLRCALSGEPIEFPVVSPSGAVFEKRLVLKYLQDYGNVDPLTRATLTADQLITLNCDILHGNDNRSKLSNRSFTILLRYLQEEWDSMVLKVFELEKQLERSNQQLRAMSDEQKTKSQLIQNLRSQLNTALKELDQLRDLSLLPPPLPPPQSSFFKLRSQSNSSGSNSARNSPPTLPPHNFVSSLPPTPIKHCKST